MSRSALNLATSRGKSSVDLFWRYLLAVRKYVLSVLRKLSRPLGGTLCTSRSWPLVSECIPIYWVNDLYLTIQDNFRSRVWRFEAHEAPGVDT